MKDLPENLDEWAFGAFCFCAGLIFLSIIGAFSFALWRLAFSIPV